MDRSVEGISWRNIVVYTVSFAAGEVAGSSVGAHFPAPHVLIFTISASVSILGLCLLTGWLIVGSADPRVRFIQRVVASGFFIGFWLGYIV